MGNLENAKDLGQSIYTKAEVNVDFAHKVSSIAGLASLDNTTPTVIVTDTYTVAAANMWKKFGAVV